MLQRRFPGGQPHSPALIRCLRIVEEFRLAADKPSRVADAIEPVGKQPGLAWTLENGLDPGPRHHDLGRLPGNAQRNSLVAHRVEHPGDPGTCAHLHPVERRNRDSQRLSPLKTQDRARLESQRPLRLATPRQELQPGAKVRQQRSLQPRLPPAIQKYGTRLVLAGRLGESSIHAQKSDQNQKANGHASSVLDVRFHEIDSTD